MIFFIISLKERERESQMDVPYEVYNREVRKLGFEPFDAVLVVLTTYH